MCGHSFVLGLCSSSLLDPFSPPPFIGSRRKDYMHGGSVRSSTSLPPVVRGRTDGLPCRRALWGMAQVMVIVLANPSAHARSASCKGERYEG